MENNGDQKSTHKNLAKNIFLRRKRFVESLQEDVYIDRLTRLPNEKAFIDMMDGLQSSWERSVSTNDVLGGAIIELDLTGLKVANDTFGKLKGGNDYLKCVAKSLEEGIREQDRVFRMGNSADEFVIHLTKTTEKKHIETILDRVDVNLRKFEVEFQDKYPGIKFGLSSTVSKYGEDFSPSAAYELSDDKMTEAKQSKILGERVGNVGRIYCNFN